MRPDAKRTMFVISEDCIGCGICRKICPMDRFTIQAQKSKYDPKGCIACMACIHACPMNAIQLTIPEKNRNARYRNAHITLCELIKPTTSTLARGICTTKKKRGKQMNTIRLNDGNDIPSVGFGVFMIPSDGPTYDAVCRHFRPATGISIPLRRISMNPMSAGPFEKGIRDRRSLSRASCGCRTMAMRPQRRASKHR